MRRSLESTLDSGVVVDAQALLPAGQRLAFGRQ